MAALFTKCGATACPASVTVVAGERADREFRPRTAVVVTADGIVVGLVFAQLVLLEVTEEDLRVREGNGPPPVDNRDAVPGLAAVLDWGSSVYGDFLYGLAWFTFWAPWYPNLKHVDFRGVALQHYEAIGLDVPHFDERLRCYELHIGLESEVYNAFKERWTFVNEVAERVSQVFKLL